MLRLSLRSDTLPGWHISGAGGGVRAGDGVVRQGLGGAAVGDGGAGEDRKWNVRRKQNYYLGMESSCCLVTADSCDC